MFISWIIAFLWKLKTDFINKHLCQYDHYVWGFGLIVRELTSTACIWLLANTLLMYSYITSWVWKHKANQIFLFFFIFFFFFIFEYVQIKKFAFLVFHYLDLRISKTNIPHKMGLPYLTFQQNWTFSINLIMENHKNVWRKLTSALVALEKHTSGKKYKGEKS